MLWMSLAVDNLETITENLSEMWPGEILLRTPPPILSADGLILVSTGFLKYQGNLAGIDNRSEVRTA